MTAEAAHQFLSSMWRGLGGEPALTSGVEFAHTGPLPSIFQVEEFAAASIAAAGLAVRELMGVDAASSSTVTVDRRLASLWFGWSIEPGGWKLPSPWDPVAGDYPTSDGWIRLHTNAPHHRVAVLTVLGVTAEREAVARAVAQWNAESLESAVIDAGGCAAVMHSADAWQRHPQGIAVSGEPLVHRTTSKDVSNHPWRPGPHRPLQGLKVLDLTRVLAGPVATRFLAGFGADVLRIDPPDWDEPAVVPDVTLGKRCARLDLRRASGRATFERLLQQADVLVHGYRADALESLGFAASRRQELCPGLVDVSLDAYGWSGPWRDRRGFDSLVQMSCGIAEEGMRRLGRDRPTPLPVQALDHATGYLMSAAVVRGLTERAATSTGQVARLSLARVAALLTSGPRVVPEGKAVTAAEQDWNSLPEQTDFGMARRLRGPLQIGDLAMQWERPAARLGSSPAAW